MKTISDQYAKLNFDLHKSEPTFGAGAFRSAKEIAQLIEPTGARTLLDYGCGKGSLKPALKQYLPALIVREYDPAIPGKRDLPKPADVVTCTDVMEHIEPEYLENVLKHLRELTQMLLITSVTTTPAEKTLADGRNAHLIVQPKEWWLAQFGKHFSKAQAFDVKDPATGEVGAFIGLFEP
jgi:hypothetical protein